MRVTPLTLMVLALGVAACDLPSQKTLTTSGQTTQPRAIDEISVRAPDAKGSSLLLSRAAIGLAAVTREISRPQPWPLQRRWAPRRYFGPIFGNSPDLHLNGEDALFVYNQFFAGHPDAAVYRKYYGPTLPTNAPTLAEAIPGTVPSSGFRDARLGLDRLTYSSRYGGSFKLTFLSIEDFQVEYRKGSAAWDIASLEMAVYVRPVPSNFNPNAPISSTPNGNVHVEFRPQGVVGYTVSTDGRLTLQDEDTTSALLLALKETAQNMDGSQIFRRDATRFSLGFVHTEFWEEIGQTRTVTGIEISDGFFFPRTTAGIAVAVVTTQVSDISLNTEPGSEEINISVTAAHVFQGQDPNSAPNFTWAFPEIDNHSSTSQRTIGVFPLAWDCGQLQTIIILPDVRERDDFTFDDRFRTDPLAFQTGALDCGGMQTAFNNGQFGLFRELPPEQLLLLQGGEVEGAMTMRTRIFVIKQ